MLVISVVTIAVVASASTMVPLFRSGVQNLGRDVSAILSNGSIGGVGSGGSTYNAGAEGEGEGTDSATPGDMNDAMDDMVNGGPIANDPNIGAPIN